MPCWRSDKSCAAASCCARCWAVVPCSARTQLSSISTRRWRSAMTDHSARKQCNSSVSLFVRCRSTSSFSESGRADNSERSRAVRGPPRGNLDVDFGDICGPPLDRPVAGGAKEPDGEEAPPLRPCEGSTVWRWRTSAGEATVLEAAGPGEPFRGSTAVAPGELPRPEAGAPLVGLRLCLPPMGVVTFRPSGVAKALQDSRPAGPPLEPALSAAPASVPAGQTFWPSLVIWPRTAAERPLLAAWEARAAACSLGCKGLTPRRDSRAEDAGEASV
mmetsp:Transcript_121314/g.258971  ORF Transcript_121314/g.258971 Transcript_121314/m.258971 type:complete len:274 (-) Transcript_121314:238-1059(-)